MKNHIKGFSQFINEKTDWFEHSGDPNFQYTPKGGWRHPDSGAGEPGEEIEHDEFMQRYGEEMPQSGRDYFGKFGKGRVKVWKEKEPTVQSKIASLSTPALIELANVIKKGLARSSSEQMANRISRALDDVETELGKRRDNDDWGSESGY
jgi:hypothetical protein